MENLQLQLCVGNQDPGFCWCGCERHYGPTLKALMGLEPWYKFGRLPWVPGPEDLERYRHDLRRYL